MALYAGVNWTENVLEHEKEAELAKTRFTGVPVHENTDKKVNRREPIKSKGGNRKNAKPTKGGKLFTWRSLPEVKNP